MGNSGQIFLVKENLACQLFLDKEKLSSQKFARVDGQQGKCDKDIIDLQHLSRKTCHIFRLHYQGKLVQEKLVEENLLVCTVGKFSVTSGLVKEKLLV